MLPSAWFVLVCASECLIWVGARVFCFVCVGGFVLSGADFDFLLALLLVGA